MVGIGLKGIRFQASGFGINRIQFRLLALGLGFEHISRHIITTFVFIVL